ncbi:MAG: DUF814 domain-containing protein, partial [Clostridia bacterium]|nr:DUF814 domain-containing protein [Clostridia bacterium]
LSRGAGRGGPAGGGAAAVGRTDGKGRGARGKARGGDPRRYRSADGWTLLVGRNSRQNEWLSLRYGRPDDWWFHVKDAAGTHVLARVPDGWPAGEPPPEATLRQAALLAAYFSEARSGSNVPVDYTRCRYVRRLRGAGRGRVSYDHHRTTSVTPRAEDLPPAADAAGPAG